MDDDEIPQPIRRMMTEDERQNMRYRRGWATGTIERVDADGEVDTRVENAWIELFNGDGTAGVFGGVRAIAALDGNVTMPEGEPVPERMRGHDIAETYAFATKAAAEAEGTPPYWYVAEYDDEDVDYGIPAP